jgi:hypothetical protein
MLDAPDEASGVKIAAAFEEVYQVNAVFFRERKGMSSQKVKKRPYS